MLVYTVLLLATSAFAAPGVLLEQHPQVDQVIPQQRSAYNQSQNYVGQGPNFGVGQIVDVPVNTQFQQPDQPYSSNAFLNPNHQQGFASPNFGVGQIVDVPVNTQFQQPDQPYSSNAFLNPNHQQGFANQPVAHVGSISGVGQVPVHRQVQHSVVYNVVPNSPVSQIPVQGVFGRSNNQQYKVVPERNVFQPQYQVDVVPTSQVGVQPRHHVAGHEGFVAKEHVSNDSAVNAKIVQQEIGVSPDGSFHNVWSSDNGIKVQEEGTIKHVGDADVAVQQGVVSYVDNDGTHFELKYVADENGFHVEGPHIPTPPPIPEAIARGLQFIAEHPYVETTTAQDENYQPGQQQLVVLDN